MRIKSSTALHFYRPELEAMRLFAFLCIFAHHVFTPAAVHPAHLHPGLRTAIPQALKYAVSLFFLLSGYLITTLLDIEKQRTGRLDLQAFYLRRLARIAPLYFCFLAGVVAIATVSPKLQPSNSALAAFTLMSGNWSLIRAGGLFAGGLGILWSINIEQQFYLVWPLLTRSLRRAHLLGTTATLIATAYGILFVLGRQGIAGDLQIRFNTLVEMQFFAAGALLALTLPRDGLSLPVFGRLGLVLTGLCCWLLGTVFFEGAAQRSWSPMALYACVMAGCVALFLGFSGAPPQWIPPSLQWLGKISYGLYVYHSLVLTLTPRLPETPHYSPLLRGARILLELLVSIGLAGLSYQWLERPFLRWKNSVTVVRNRPA